MVLDLLLAFVIYAGLALAALIIFVAWILVVCIIIGGVVYIRDKKNNRGTTEEVDYEGN